MLSQPGPAGLDWEKWRTVQDFAVVITKLIVRAPAAWTESI
jgi:hypothetical protein